MYRFISLATNNHRGYRYKNDINYNNCYISEWNIGTISINTNNFPASFFKLLTRFSWFPDSFFWFPDKNFVFLLTFCTFLLVFGLPCGVFFVFLLLFLPSCGSWMPPCSFFLKSCWAGRPQTLAGRVIIKQEALLDKQGYVFVRL